MDPLPDIDNEDALDRKPFVDALEAAVRRPREHSLTFGLDGAWGSGKTTILNALANRLRRHQAIIVRFDAWSFREPDRVVSNYLLQLGRALVDAGALPNVRPIIRRLGLGIAQLAGSRVHDVAKDWLSLDGTASVEETLDDLRANLGAQRRLVVVLVDDLDRLDQDELHAALRMLRLFANLPRVAHVLAYDRRQLGRVLFPSDMSGQMAGDYLAKIVNVELSLATPTPQAADRLLGAALQPLLDIVGDQQSQRFVQRLNSVPRQVFVEALPTPREIRRVAATTALVWPQLARDVNLFDLFVLQVIHARFPRVFGAIHAHPEWFTNLKWSGDLWRISEEKRWLEEGTLFMEALQKSADDDEVVAARLLALIFPNVDSRPGRAHPQEAEARRERLACHPEVFPRYFQLSVPREQVAESSMEDLAKQLLTDSGELRSSIVQRAVEDSVRRRAAEAFFDQWDAFLELLAKDYRPSPFDLANDIAVGLARAAIALPSEPNNPLAARRAAARCIVKVAGTVDTNDEVSRILSNAINACATFAVSGLIVFLASLAEDGRGVLTDRALDEQLIRGAFDNQVRTRFFSKLQSTLFDLPDDDLAEVLYRTADVGTVREVFASALAQRPGELARILRFAVMLDVIADRIDEPMVLRDDLADLHRRLDLPTIYRITQRLSINYWEKPLDRALVGYFRRRYEQVAKEPGQSQ